MHWITIYANKLYCTLLDNNNGNNNNYDIYICDIKHYLNVKHISTKWKFQCMWKRQYINRVFDVDIFYNHLLLLNL